MITAHNRSTPGNDTKEVGGLRGTWWRAVGAGGRRGQSVNAGRPEEQSAAEELGSAVELGHGEVEGLVAVGSRPADGRADQHGHAGVWLGWGRAGGAAALQRGPSPLQPGGGGSVVVVVARGRRGRPTPLQPGQGR